MAKVKPSAPANLRGQASPKIRRGEPSRTLRRMTTELSAVRGVGAPARRALAAAGYTCLEQLDGAEHGRLLTLHGVGPRALERLQSALEGRGLSLAGDLPAPQDRGAVLTVGPSGQRATDLKTRPTARSPEDFLASLPWPRRVDDGRALLELFAAATGEPGTLWGPSMIGFGRLHYRYATGREGDTFRVGFSPRRAALSLYGLQGHPRSEELLGRLGPHRRGVSCVYVTALARVDREVLRDLVDHSWTSDPKAC